MLLDIKWDFSCSLEVLPMALKIASSFLTKKYKATYALATYECFPIFHLWTVC
jgi:hypothetical protein